MISASKHQSGVSKNEDVILLWSLGVTYPTCIQILLCQKLRSFLALFEFRCRSPEHFFHHVSCAVQRQVCSCCSASWQWKWHLAGTILTSGNLRSCFTLNSVRRLWWTFSVITLGFHCFFYQRHRDQQTFILSSIQSGSCGTEVTAQGVGAFRWNPEISIVASAWELSGTIQHEREPEQ